MVPFLYPKKRLNQTELSGKMTTAYLLSQIYLKEYEPVEMRFDQILRAVQEEKVDAGLICYL